MEFTEIGRKRVTELAFAKQLQDIYRAQPNDEGLDAMLLYTALMACADESGHVSASDKEGCAFVNANMAELKRMLFEARLLLELDQQVI